MARQREPRTARVLAAALLAALAAGACGDSKAQPTSSLDRAADDDWVGAQVADFRMTASDGREVTLASLAGRPFVLDFIFTTCTGPCPAMSEAMTGLQDELKGSDVRLVSVSVDPETDTLAVLAAYAAAHRADPERWFFLRGDEASVQDLAASVLLAAQRNPMADPGMQVSHSPRFLVVDGAGRVRGYYDGTSPAGRAAAVARARWLAAQ